MLRAEYERGPDAPLHDAAAAFYALALVSAGDAVAAASVALKALAPHLPRYTRSVAAYADELIATALTLDRRDSAQGEHGRVARGAPVDSMRRPRNQEYTWPNHLSRRASSTGC